MTKLSESSIRSMVDSLIEEVRLLQQVATYEMTMENWAEFDAAWGQAAELHALAEELMQLIRNGSPSGTFMVCAA